MARVRAIRAQVTRQAQLRWTRFWRWYRAASRRKQIAVGLSALVGACVISSLAVAVFNAGAHSSGTSPQSGLVPTAAHGSAPRVSPRSTATATIRGHGHRKTHGHGR